MRGPRGKVCARASKFCADATLWFVDIHVEEGRARSEKGAREVRAGLPAGSQESTRRERISPIVC